MTRNVLVVEDNPDIAKLVSLHLKDLDCEVALAADGLRGLDEARARRYDLIILDLMLPGMEGLELCRRLRGETDYTPILMLTAKSSEVDRVVGLEIGADDYLTKPFSISELLARVKAIFRRVDALGPGRREEPKRLNLGAMAIDVEKRNVTVAGQAIDLTAKEFALLSLLARRRGEVLSRTLIAEQVWDMHFDSDTNVVDVAVRRLRRKVDDPFPQKLIHTVRGVGYLLKA